MSSTPETPASDESAQETAPEPTALPASPTREGAPSESDNPSPVAPAQESTAGPFEQGTDWKASSRKWEDRAKANKALADERAEKIREYETRDQIAAWKAEVAEATGVPAVALAGSTREEIEAHATTLAPLITAAGQPPKAEPVPGITRTPQAPSNIPLRDQIAAAEQSGDKALVGQLKAIQLGSAT